MADFDLTTPEGRAAFEAHRAQSARRSKWNNVRTEVDGIMFDSRKEANRYSLLLLMQRAGKIKCLELQPAFPVEINGQHVFTYKADFRYLRSGQTVVEDVKGAKTDVYRLKKKCVEAFYGIEIQEV